MAVERTIALHGTRRVGWRHSFSTEDAAQADALALFGRAVVLAQLVTQTGQQGVVRGHGQIVHVDLVRQALATGCTHANKRGSGLHGPNCQGQFGLGVITGINDRIGQGGQQSGPVVLQRARGRVVRKLSSLPQRVA